MTRGHRGKVETHRQRAKPTLLSGGNPQIPLGYGEEPVQTYLDAVPGWKQAVSREINKSVTVIVAGVKEAVKWNSPSYGVEEGIYALSYHCTDQYVKMTFFKGEFLDPKPRGTSKQPHVRYLDVRENHPLGERFPAWVRAASRLPGERM